MSTTIRRDPFARGSWRRFCLGQLKTPDSQRESCAWCGQQPARLYTYVWEPDSAYGPVRNPWPYARWYCAWSCFASWQG